MRQLLRSPIPAAVLVASLLAACGGEGPEADAPPPSPVDPAALEAYVEPADPAPAHVADWTPSLPALREADVREVLAAAGRDLAAGRLLAAGWPAVPTGADGEPVPETSADADTDGTSDAVDAAAPGPATDQQAAAAAPGLIWPPGPEPGALERYLAVAAFDPENTEAATAIRTIADELIQRGRAAIREGRLVDAQRFERVVTRASPQHPQLAVYRLEVEAGQRARALVARGESRVHAGRLLQPEGGSAVAAFREALAAVPDYLPAHDALARVQRERLDAALVAAQQGDYDGAERLHAEAGRVIPGSSAWQDMAARLVELRRERSGELVTQGNAAVDALDLEVAARRLADAERVSPQAAGLDELARRIELARHYGHHRPGQVFREPLAGGGQAPEVVVLAHGRFRMGAAEGESMATAHERPAHEVAFARGFAIARNEVTVGDFARFVSATGYRSLATREGRAAIYDERSGAMAERDGIDWRHDYTGREAAPDLPVVHVAFEDAVAYAGWLSAQTGQRYRLPTEAEFEYALRGGRDSAYPWGEGLPQRVVGNLTGDGDRSRSGRQWSNAIRGYSDGHWGPAPVRSFPAEAFATFDLIGNVSEWVLDCWHDGYRRAPVDGSAWVNPGCTERVVRGASWASTVDRARSAWRQAAPAHSRHARLGFRVVRELQAPGAGR
ncbi:formylglycine-generating enzyme family protein [Arenimonas composti]|uniref:Sulfatase-modifying factor enzyme-like domain-containing protein n=1 Tax=Arenimonas composti TR7-09 = DSM 18010 TaxID=1121013 RepID=A0A091BBQ6_9GAMM|nr:formylglycine-generating enzyme family protein [Arenimonas composti]KFN50083.1 hypothetical protein P873_00905 [Arenimonas composti TR7-09 = DSM 18010]